METVIIFAAAIAAIWVPHLIGHAIIRARYAYRVRTGYMPKSTGINS